MSLFASMKQHGTTLAIFAACTTGLTAMVYSLTKETIATKAAEQQKELLNQVVSPSLYDNDLFSDCYFIRNSAVLGNNQLHKLYVARKNGIPVAAALESTAPDGYSGAIQLLVGTDFNGNVLGVRVTEHHETPGLGDKIDLRISNWIELFRNKPLNSKNDPHWAVKKDGGDFDQFTGATITPRAVINAAKRTAYFMQSLSDHLGNYPTCHGDNE